MTIKRDQLIRIGSRLAKPALAVVICLIFISFFGGRISAISSSIKEKRTADAILQQRVENIGQIQEDFRKLGEENFEAVVNSFPLPDEIVDATGALAQLASSSGVRIEQNLGSTLTPANLDTKDPKVKISTIDLTLTVRGNMNSVTRFLSALEKFRYFYSISGMVGTSATDRGWESDLSMVLRGKLYVKQIQQ